MLGLAPVAGAPVAGALTPPAAASTAAAGLVSSDGARGGYAVKPGWVFGAVWQQGYELSPHMAAVAAEARAAARRAREEEEVAVLS